MKHQFTKNIFLHTLPKLLFVILLFTTTIKLKAGDAGLTGREIDSLALIDLYNSTNGASWTNNTNWLVTGQSIDTWYGVTVSGGRVTQLVIENNNLVGEVPSSIGNLTSLTSLSLQGNQLNGVIPSTIGNLTSLTNLSFTNNQMSGPIPTEIGNLTSLTGLYLSVNQFSFDGLENVAQTFVNLGGNLVYSPQSPSLNVVNQSGVLKVSGIGGTLANNSYTWYQVGDDKPWLTMTGDSTFTLPESTYGDFYVTVTNSIATQLTLTSDTITVLSPPTSATDSLALVSLYNATNGTSWTNGTNWLMTGKYVGTWYGVTVSGGRVTGLNLGGNNLTGSIPSSIGDLTAITDLEIPGNSISGSVPTEIGNLTALTFLDISRNQLSGSIPSSIGNLTALQTLYLNDDQFTGVPSTVGQLGVLYNFTLYNNQLTFTTLESLVQAFGARDMYFNYSPQANINVVNQNGVLRVSAGGTLANNTYQWYQNGNVIATNVGDSTYTVTSGNYGDYYVTVTNSIATQLTLTSNTVAVYPPASLNFDGVDDYVSVPYSATTNPSVFTAEAWVKVNNTTTQYQTVICSRYWDGGALFQGFNIYVLDGGGISATFGAGTEANWSGVDAPNGVVVPNQWTHIAITHDGTTFTLYVNGVTIANTNAPFAANINTDMRIGAGATGGSPSAFLNGDIDEVRIWSIARSQSQIRYDINKTVNDTTGLRASYDFANGIPNADNTGVTTLIDLTSNHNDGTLNNFSLNGSTSNFVDDIVYPPLIFGFSPTSGRVGSSIIINGVNFDSNSSDNFVQFNNVQATVTSGTTVQLLVTVPSSATTGAISITNSNGTGISYENFEVTIPINQADSLALVDLYNATNGTSWTNNTNWLVVGQPVSTWNGVTVSGDRVTQLYISNNNLLGTLSSSIGNLTALTSFVLSSNKLNGTIPSEISNLTSLTNLDLSNNQFTFAGLENVVQTFNGLGSNLIYSPQSPSLDIVNQSGVLKVNDGGTSNDNSYTWYKVGNSKPLMVTTRDTMALSGNYGRFYVTVTNSIATALTLMSDTIVVNSSMDSLALVDIFNSTNGTNWTKNTNWLVAGQSISSWYGITVSDGRVTQLTLGDNNLVGTIPYSIGNLTSLTDLLLSGNELSGSIPTELINLDSLKLLWLNNNQLSGAVPTGIANFTNLTSLYLNDNQLTSLPNLSSLLSLDSLTIQNNKLDFADIEPNASVKGFVYSPQDSVDVNESVLEQTDIPFTFKSTTETANTKYQWQKNGTDISGATLDSLYFADVSFADDATYSYSATDALVPKLTLYSRKKVLRVSSLQRDSLALRALYTSTNGTDWTNKSNWLTTPIGTGNWFGVTVSNNRVTQVNLPSNNLIGQVPAVFSDIQNLTAVDLSGNKIQKLPDLSSLSNVASLNVSSNSLDFASLIPNVNINGINYVNQAKLGVVIDSLVDYNTNVNVIVTTQGVGNVYQWTLNGNAISGATDSLYQITSINRTNMGTYVANVTNPAVPNLTLTTNNQQVRAVATLSGKFETPDGTAIGKGNILLFKINSTGAYDTTVIKSLAADGTFMLQKVVLDDYELFGMPDTTAYPTALPTYYANTIYWEKADTLSIDGNLTGLDFEAVVKPSPSTGDGMISGTFDETTTASGGRVLTKRVASAGVSVSRSVSTGKTAGIKYILVAYVMTDENGAFTIPHLPADNYNLDIQYPGYPMDSSSYIVATVGSTPSSKQVFVSAAVKNNKISVQLLKITGIEEPDNRFSIYPVPAKAIMNIKVNETMSGLSYRIINLQGQNVNSGPLNSLEMNKVNVSQLSAGMYVVELLQGGSTVKTFKIIIEN